MNKYVQSALIAVIIIFSQIGNSAAQNTKVTYRQISNLSYYPSENVTVYQRERCLLDVYYPENKPDFTTVIWFHGGGLTSGEKFIPEKLKNQNIAVIAVNYRLSPKAKCPDYIEDAAAAIAWAFKNITTYGGNPTKIVVAGHSAGAYLTLMTGLDKKWLAPYKIDPDSIVMLVPFSGQAITHMTIRQERGISDKQPLTDEFAALWHIRPDAPPLHLITGNRELEMLGRYEENAYLWRMMKVAGHQQTYLYELDGFDHGGMAEPGYEILLKLIKTGKPFQH